MTEPIDDGGPAFAARGAQQRMSLRDYFAGLAMQAMLGNPAFAEHDGEEITDKAFWQAESMVERSKA